MVEFKKFLDEDLALAAYGLEESTGAWADSESSAAFKSDEESNRIAALSDKVSYGAITLGFLSALGLGLVLSVSLSKELSKMSNDISIAAETTSGASVGLSSSSSNLAGGMTEAASSLAETVASLQELSSMTQLNTKNAKTANTLSQECRNSAEKGELEIQRLISAMTEISSGSKKIEEIISVIDDIAFQTNLLALNAAVEAARAGEQGRGFAVVADAVRALAQRSSEAAKEINLLISENVQKTTAGSGVAVASGVVLKDIVDSVNKVANLNTEISSASDEQAIGIDQIAKAMNQLDEATQNNAATAETVAGLAVELSGQSGSLAELSGRLFKLVTGKGNGGDKNSDNQKSKKKNADSSESILPLVSDHEPTSGLKTSIAHDRAGSKKSGNKIRNIANF